MSINVTYTSPPDRVKEVCDERSVYKMPTVQLDASNLPSGYKIPKLCPINVDWITRKATVCKRVRVYADADSAATTVLVEKNHPFSVGNYISDGSEVGKAITAIVYGTSYDTLTVSFGVAVTAGTVLHEANTATAKVEKATANHLCYNNKVAVNGDSLTPIGKVYSIVEANLTVPVTASDKTSLTARFMFI